MKKEGAKDVSQMTSTLEIWDWRGAAGRDDKGDLGWPFPPGTGFPDLIGLLESKRRKI